MGRNSSFCCQQQSAVESFFTVAANCKGRRRSRIHTVHQEKSTVLEKHNGRWRDGTRCYAAHVNRKSEDLRSRFVGETSEPSFSHPQFCDDIWEEASILCILSPPRRARLSATPALCQQHISIYINSYKSARRKGIPCR